ncbi:MAG: winged helix-turn-helix transcriptional regulator [Anaerolineae bacterium]|nr:winged helix-turn-helix transcriptional regulator [Anaerolineae bacterium]
MSQTEIEQLSERESELVELLSEGMSNREIAQKLHISPNTVKVHLRNIYAKLDVRSRTEATRVALESGLVRLRVEQTDISLASEQTSVEDNRLELDSVQQAMAFAPFAQWKRTYLIAAALVVAIGLWVTWSLPAAPDLAPSAATSAPRLPMPGQSRWKTLAQMPTPRSKLAAVFHDNRVFAIGGETAGGAVSDIVEIFDPEQNRWTSGANKITPVADIGAVVLYGKLFVPGGRLADETMTNRLEVYEPDNGPSGAWQSAGNMPDARCAYAITVYEGELYLFGGWDGTTVLTTSYVYNARQDQWHELTPMPTGRAYAAAGAIGQYIYVVGGEDGQAELSTCEVYDPNTNGWDTCPPMRQPRNGIGAAVIDDKLHVVGGKRRQDDPVFANEFLELSNTDPTAGEWKPFASPLFQEWLYPGIAASDTTLYTIGGKEKETIGSTRAYSVIYRIYLPGVPGN